jgi:hypothetical protein
MVESPALACRQSLGQLLQTLALQILHCYQSCLWLQEWAQMLH